MLIEVMFIIVLILISVCFATALWSEKEHHNDTKRCLELSSKQIKELSENLESLQNELKTYETWERVVHVEKFVIDPLVFNVKLDIDRDVFNDTDSLKSFCLDQTARHISEALKKNDNLYQLIYEQNPMLMRDNIIIRFRLSPFKEDADWSKVPISTKLNDICHYKPLEDCNPTTDFSVL